jgi:hypothetical protein
MVSIIYNSPGLEIRDTSAERKMASFTLRAPCWSARYACPMAGQTIVETPKNVGIRQLLTKLMTIAKSAKCPARPLAR